MLPYRDAAFPYVEPDIALIAVQCPWCGARGVAEAATVADCAACGARFVVDLARAGEERPPQVTVAAADPTATERLPRDRWIVALAVLTLVVAAVALPAIVFFAAALFSHGPRGAYLCIGLLACAVRLGAHVARRL